MRNCWIVFPTLTCEIHKRHESVFEHGLGQEMRHKKNYIKFDIKVTSIYLRHQPQKFHVILDQF